MAVFLSTPVGTPGRFPDVVIQRGRVLPPTKAVQVINRHRIARGMISVVLVKVMAFTRVS